MLLNLKRIFYLKFTIVIEVLYALLPNFYKRFIKCWEYIPAVEWKYLSKNFNLSAVKRIIIVGGGGIPFTAMYLNKIWNEKTFVIIEKSKISSLVARLLLKKLGYNNCKVINITAQDYSDYNDSLIIITLHVVKKQEVIDKILNKNYNYALIIRQPTGSYIRVFDYVSLNDIKYSAIKQEPNFESVFLARLA
jgi:hypothetical protein